MLQETSPKYHNRAHLKKGGHNVQQCTTEQFEEYREAMHYLNIVYVQRQGSKQAKTIYKLQGFDAKSQQRNFIFNLTTSKHGAAACLKVANGELILWRMKEKSNFDLFYNH